MTSYAFKSIILIVEKWSEFILVLKTDNSIVNLWDDLNRKNIEEYSYFNCNITNCMVKRGGSRWSELCYYKLVTHNFFLIISLVYEAKRVIN